MNKNCYRIIFNKTRGSLMVVAETAVSQGKAAPGTTAGDGAKPGYEQTRTSLVTVRMLAFGLWSAFGMIMWPVSGYSQIVADPNAPAGQRATIFNAANGVPQVNIQTPSAAGVSRNTYSQFDVQQQGAILNNSRTNVQTQLGGWVQGNPWLANGTARVILNEVNSSNPSLLRGYVEVAGSRAQVIIANPAGLACDGCGFINASRATLTTGTPIVNSGNLEGYRVQGGAITISGAGLDASQADYTDLIARSIQVNAGIWANQLKINAGASQINVDDSGNSTAASAIAGFDAAPAFAIDVAQLGGMYAGKITLIGTEAGVGVRNAGHIGAIAGEVIVTADGQLENAGRISGAGHIQIDTKGGIQNSGTIYAQADANLGTHGDIGNSGVIASQGNTTLAASGANSRIFSTSGSVLGAGIQADGSVGSSGTLTLNATQSITAQGKNLSNDQSMGAQSINIASSQTIARNISLSASTGDLDATAASLDASDTLTVDAAQMLRTDNAYLSAAQINVVAHELSNVHGEIVQIGTGDSKLSVTGTLDNTQGRLATNSQNFGIDATTLINVHGKLEHAGGGRFRVDAMTMDGARGQIGSNGVLDIKSSIVALDEGSTVAQQLSIDAITLSNRYGSIVQTGSGAASIQASSLLDNTGGKLTGNGSMLVSANHLDNTQGQISSGQALHVSTTQAVINRQGILAANQNVIVNGSQIDNTEGIIGSVQGEVAVISASGSLDNTAGRIEAAQSVNAVSAGLTNTDGVITGSSLILNSQAKSLDNTRGKITTTGADDDGTLDVQSGSLTNDAGLIQAQGRLTLDTHGKTLSNVDSGSNGGILGQSDIVLNTGNLDNQAGYIGSAGELSVNSAAVANTKGGLLISAGRLNVIGSAMNNQGGQIQALDDVAIHLGNGGLDNTASLVRSGHTLDITAGSIVNTNTQGNHQGLEGNSVTLSASHIDNRAGAIRAEDALAVRSSSGIDNTQGLISSGKTASVQDASLAGKSLAITNTDGTLLAGQSLVVDSASMTGDGKLLSQGDISISLVQDYFHTGELQANGSADLETAGTLTNAATLLAGKSLNIKAAGIDNQAAGQISAAQVKLMAADSHSLSNRGLVDGQDTIIETAMLNNIGTGRIYGDRVAIGASTVNNYAENGAAPVIAARNRLDIGATSINNREHGLIFSAGDLAIGGSLDVNQQATGQATILNNNSATIEALGSSDIGAKQINNTNEHFSTAVQQLGSTPIVEYQGSGSPNRYLAGSPDVYIYNDESDHLHTPEGNYESWSRYVYDQTSAETRVQNSDPGQILSGGAMRITADNVFNDKSRIIAGGTLTGNIGVLNNTEVLGERIITDSGTITSFWRDHKKGRDGTGSSSAAYTPPSIIQTIRLTPTVYQQNTVSSGSGIQIAAHSTSNVSQAPIDPSAASVTQSNVLTISPITQVAALNGNGTSGPAQVIRTGGVNIKVPDNSLFRLSPSSNSGYLIETDPRFANYRDWLSSDFLLKALSVDPAAMQKRLGDGFYEQKLIREQVAQLTGRRFLDGYASDEEQYRALMENAATFAQVHQLRPGIALSAEQMAALTSDMVWLVEKDVISPNGEITKALVPQLYVRVQDGDLQASGALIAGSNVNLNVTGDLTNSGTIAGRNVVALTAENIRNLGGRIAGNDVGIAAHGDLDNIGGVIEAANSMTATAGRDLNVISTVRTQSNAQGSRTNIDRVATLHITGGSGTLVAMAGRDVNLAAAIVANSAGGTVIAAGNDLNLTTVSEASSNNIAWDSKNYRKDSSRSDVGTTIQGEGDIRLQAGNDLNAKAAGVTSQQRVLIASAGKNINLTAGETNRSVDEGHQHKGSSSAFATKTITTRDTINETATQGTSLSGNTTTVLANQDINIQGSNVVSTLGTTLAAQNNINIKAATGTTVEGHFKDEMTSGLFSGGGIGFTWGTQQKSVDNQSTRRIAAASTVGSTEGDVIIQAGKNYRQVGSDVIALQGNIDIAAKRVEIVEAQNTSDNSTETQFKQSGLTVALTSPVISAIQTAQQMKEASSQTKDDRMKALAGATTGLAAKSAYDAVAQNPSQAGGVNISISIGASKSQSNTVQASSTAMGSNMAAGGDISISATGAGKDSDLIIQGSNVKAGNNVALKSDDEINLLAAKNTEEQHSTNKSSSGSIGVSFGTDGFGVTVSASMGRGHADGEDVNWSNTHVEAGSRLTLNSGSDTTLKGALAQAEQVVANVGGNLNIESLQDTSFYDSKQQSIGGSLTVGAGVSGSLNISNSKINSSFASVTEQSGIKTGDGGFDVNVAGNTDLKGGAITSTQVAVDSNSNRFNTGGELTLSDIQNSASYGASAVGVNIGNKVNQSGKFESNGTGAGIGKDSGDAASTTQAAITGIAGNKDARTGDKESGIAKIFDADKVQKEINAQVTITQTFGQEASKAVDGYVQGKRKELRNQLKSASTEDEKAAAQKELSDLRMQEQAMNILIGAVSGMAGSSVTKEALSAAADEMRQLMIQDSQKFEGVTDGKTPVLSNDSGESEGVRGDGKKVGGTRIDLDLLCGPDNERCVIKRGENDVPIRDAKGKTQIELNSEGQVQFDPKAAQMSLEAFLQTDEGKKLAGATGGIQGTKGTLFGVPYKLGSWQDKLIEAFAGTHDFVGGKLSGLYDDQGNATRGRSNLESKTQDMWSASGAIVVSAPFAMSELLLPQAWQAISILLKAAQ